MVLRSSSPVHTTSTGEGPPLVFLHGAWTSSDLWAPQVEQFHDQYQVITVDLRGHGQSKHPPHTEYSLDQLTADIEHVIDTQTTTDPILIGLSLGGVIAHTYATGNPDSLRGIILADTPRTLPPLPFAQYTNPFHYPHSLAYTAINTLGPARWFRLLITGIETTIGHPWLGRTKTARDYALREVRDFTTPEFIAVYDTLTRITALTPQPLGTPSLLINGDHEPPAFRAQTNSIHRSLTDVTRVTLSDAGHLSNLDNPTDFNEALNSFFSDIGL